MNKNQLIKIIESSAISLAASFPVFASIATGWSEYKNHLQAENIKFILEVFYKKLKELENKVDSNYLDSNELKALILQTSVYGKDEITLEKKQYLAYFLANSCTKEYSKSSIKITVLETIKKLSPFDLHLLKLIGDSTEDNWKRMAKYNPANSSWTAVDEKMILKKFPNHDELNIISTLEYLNVTGVIENISSREFFRSLPSQIEENKLYNELNDLAKKEMELLNNGSFNAVKEAEVMRGKIITLEKQYKESMALKKRSRNHYKSYNISALGVKVLDFLE